MAVSKSDIGFFLTSLTPDLAQANLSQSLGGYISTSNLYPSTTLTQNLDRNNSTINLTAVGSLSGKTYLGINSEIIKTNAISTTIATATARGLNGSNFFHASSDVVFGLTLGHLFNDRVNDDLKQYRCIAIKNSHAADSAFQGVVYVKQNTVNPSSVIRIAVEQPRNDHITGSATATGGNITFSDSSVGGLFADNHFRDANLTFTGGSNLNQARIINSYTDTPGTFVLDSSLPFSITIGDAYRIDPGPAQRIPSGLLSPVFGEGRISELSKPKGIVGLQSGMDRSNMFTAANASDSISIEVNGRDHSDDLQFNDVVYVWLERTLIKDTDAYADNSAILTFNYLTA
jgi:hypothetical protein